MVRQYKPKEPRRKCIKAVQYTYRAKKGHNLKRVPLGEIKLNKDFHCPECNSELEVGGQGALMCSNHFNCSFCRTMYYEVFK